MPPGPSSSPLNLYRHGGSRQVSGGKYSRLRVAFWLAMALTIVFSFITFTLHNPSILGPITGVALEKTIAANGGVGGWKESFIGILTLYWDNVLLIGVLSAGLGATLSNRVTLATMSISGIWQFVAMAWVATWASNLFASIIGEQNMTYLHLALLAGAAGYFIFDVAVKLFREYVSKDHVPEAIAGGWGRVMFKVFCLEVILCIDAITMVAKLSSGDKTIAVSVIVVGTAVALVTLPMIRFLVTRSRLFALAMVGVICATGMEVAHHYLGEFYGDMVTLASFAIAAWRLRISREKFPLLLNAAREWVINVGKTCQEIMVDIRDKDYSGLWQGAVALGALVVFATAPAMAANGG